ncbi:hypothetical protein SARC_15743 [Sphaeroforma arctica JP610]|uniref:Uncharacterized protein n=1 Tax=Sphaeroforma arctica JP610 TaxID=667725 RepID=A0A0L0F556_9EUKA|nr:hypothetical protein SARC_15743 [Sphaeroforma arctica JP610]KNC71716.1 hypothetical protein SARC_15743 [Sphaeroforma arctica JP610]|eukprot:XP_014145618.1 hypothetical protein SARC_15743 [Sphaeroforma arctica JP610]
MCGPDAYSTNADAVPRSRDITSILRSTATAIPDEVQLQRSLSSCFMASPLISETTIQSRLLSSDEQHQNKARCDRCVYHPG